MLRIPQHEDAYKVVSEKNQFCYYSPYYTLASSQPMIYTVLVRLVQQEKCYYGEH